MEGLYTNSTGEVLLDNAVIVHVADAGADHPTTTCRLNLLVKLEANQPTSKVLYTWGYLYDSVCNLGLSV